MVQKTDTAIITYNGIDGACAAAVALLKFPQAQIHITSAARVAETLQALRHERPREVHVCGLGVHCDWADLESAAAGLEKGGARLYWHCGRGYLDHDRNRFSAICRPIFQNLGTNAAALAQYFVLSARSEANILTDLARFDQHVDGCNPLDRAAPDQAFWLDFLEASMAQYFKYLEQDAYVRAIRQLARRELGPQDHAMVKAFRATRYTHLLHGRSQAIKELKLRIQKCARADRHVLITGESGVGKEHVAHLVWERSAQSGGPFIPVNCAVYAGSGNLANSDLFGHVKGAFTGAVAARRGKFAESDGGILFLDELEELPPEVQAKLLRVVEDGHVTPEGADRPERRVDVRIIAATNRGLPALVRAGQFRADLYHRLSTLQIEVPPLRERLHDIEPIVAERIARLHQEGHNAPLTPADLKTLRGYDWPGNVRQLIKVIERSAFLGIPVAQALDEEKALGDTSQPRNPAHDPALTLLPTDRSQVRPIKEIQRQYARRAWELHDRNYTATARALKVETNTLRYTYLKNEE